MSIKVVRESLGAKTAIATALGLYLLHRLDQTMADKKPIQIKSSTEPEDKEDSIIQETIRRLRDGRYRLYTKEIDEETGKRRALGTFPSYDAARGRESQLEFYKIKHEELKSKFSKIPNFLGELYK